MSRLEIKKHPPKSRTKVHDYPTDEDLDKIATWPHDDFTGCMAFIKERWRFDAWREADGVYEIATYGWSGNEALLDALRNNFMLWSLYWHQSHRGGGYIFCADRDKDLPCCG